MKVKITPFRSTLSICPVCKKQIAARLVKKSSGWYMEKFCDEHGSYSTVVWRGAPELTDWDKYKSPAEDSPPPCPSDCGLCSRHLQSTCCVLIEVTSRCNLHCSFCFAESEDGHRENEKTPDELYKIFRELVRDGRSFLQLSGGEPTVRDDLPEIVAAAKRAGCDSIQLNSNGIRLGEDRAFTKKLADAGLSFVFMQFDGLDDYVYKKLRNRPLLQKKLDAIRVCDEFNIGVTLVPTIVPGVNDNQIGDIIKFAIENSPAVRGVHFQPVSYFGRYPQTPKNSDRITLPEIVTAIEVQTNGLVKTKDLAPSCCDHPRCGFHGDFVVLPDKLLALTQSDNQNSCCSEPSSEEALRNRRFVSRRWKRDGTPISDNLDMSSMDAFLSRVKTHGFTITGMAFQDAYNLDITRLRRCSLHVYDNGKIVPFCSYYI